MKHFTRYFTTTCFLFERLGAASEGNPFNLNPVAVYLNAELQRKQILEENKGKSGIYLWTNTLNGKSYVGSAVDLKNRLKNYYSLKLMGTKIKYGHSNFKLEILEYCERSDVIDREKFYINLLRPENNLLPTAGS